MGDANSDIQLLEEEEHRLSTFEAQNFIAFIDNAQLAKAGFFFSPSDKIVKCFACNVELKASDAHPGFKVLSFHREKSTDCSFIKKLISQKLPRWKSFLSVADSLRFEKARVDTFVDWPLTFLSPEKLAEDGFYYLRRQDHCACIFCRGIIGAWEETDTPRGEHSKHFPQCPFIKGKPVGNIPMKQSLILQKFSNFSCDKVCNPLELNSRTTSEGSTTTVSGDGDVTGLGRQSENCSSKITEKKNGINLKDFGLVEYRGPKHKQYITLDSRVNSFKNWPEGVKQQPSLLAEAGFYYCGPGDQVRCFHCGNGICNWEDEDVPWEIHALLYPKCSYVLLTKGQDYVDKMQNRPLDINFDHMEKFVITESELDALMELDIMCEVKALNFPEAHIKEVLRNRVETKGIPFFTAEQCATAVFEYVEEKTRMFLETYNESNDDEVTDVISSGSESGSTSITPPNIAAALPELPPNTTSSSVIPLPQIKRHIPISSLPRPTSLNDSQTTVPSLVNGSSGLQQSLAYGLSLETRHHIQRSLPLLAHMDISEQRKVMSLSCELPSLGMKKSASSPGEDKSSDKLREELDRARETVMCKVCLNADMSIVFLPCSHMATCAACAVNLSKCPVCREEIKYTIKPIFS